MRALMLIGGFAGFLIGMLSALSQSCGWSAVFLRASVVACLVGWMVRWLGKVWLGSLIEVHQQRLAEAAAAAAAKPATNPTKN
jgi:hypothetical protein